MDRRARGGWLLTAHAAYGIFAGLCLGVLGLLVGRPDMVVVGAPIVLASVWGIARHPHGMPDVEVSEPRPIYERGEVNATLRIGTAMGVPTVRLRVAAESHRSAEVVVYARTDRELPLSVRTARTGRRRYFRVDYVAAGPDSIYRSDLQVMGPKTITLLPQAAALREVPNPFQLHGLTGPHNSRRAGTGGDFRNVDVFVAGDRLRGIDWKTTARRRGGSPYPDLYVKRHFANADAHVMLVIDPRDNVGPDVSTWSTGEINPLDTTALDIARAAGATLARHYLEQGDRVGFVDMARGGRTLLPGGGRRHLHRLVHHLAIAESDGESRRYARAPQIPSGGLVVVFSTFLDDVYAEMAGMWRHEGQRVLAVDVLPDPVTHGLTPHAEMAFRMLWMERHDRLTDMVSAGVELVRWREDGRTEPVALLSALSRTGVRRR